MVQVVHEGFPRSLQSRDRLNPGSPISVMILSFSAIPSPPPWSSVLPQARGRIAGNTISAAIRRVSGKQENPEDSSGFYAGDLDGT